MILLLLRPRYKPLIFVSITYAAVILSVIISLVLTKISSFAHVARPINYFEHHIGDVILALGIVNYIIKACAIVVLYWCLRIFNSLILRGIDFITFRT